jgi:dTDP-4-amino-4,6-dideoxygalactose transaminase
VNQKIPFLDLVTPHLELEEELVSVFRKALQTAGFIGGANVEDLEHEFAEFCDVAYSVGVGSGTDALRFALLAAGILEGDSVITVSNTFIATTEAISQAGAMPEFVDVDEQTYNMDPAKLRAYLEQCKTYPSTGRLISRRTGRPITAIVPVHLYGQTADMDPILEIAEAYKLLVVEDACQAHGAEYFSAREGHWKKVGSMGTASAFSFYPGKNLGACGEAGAVTTNDEALALKVKILRDHGQVQKYYHSMEGYNGRLDAIQAGILRAKLKHLPEWNKSRRQAADRYRELLGALSCEVIVPWEAPCARAVYHLYVVRTKNRDQLRKHLAELGVDTGIHYPVPLHLQDAYRKLGYQHGDLPVTERVAAEVISLPMFPSLQADQQRHVANLVMNFVSPAMAA